MKMIGAKQFFRGTIFAMLLAGPAFAANGPLGLGVILGEPTGFSGKYFLDADRNRAIDMGLAWSLDDDSGFHIHGDYLLHNYSLLRDAFHVTKGKLPLYYGLGGRFQFREHNHDDEFGLRIPLGMSYMFADIPIDLFAELAPVVNFVPDTGLDLEGGVGVRFYF